MSWTIWVAMTAMVLVAIALVARPLLVDNRRRVVVALAVAVPAITAALYFAFGSPNVESGRSMPAAISSAAANTSSAGDRRQVGSVSSMIDGLAQRLHENPDDGKGWLLLARSYKHLNRDSEALDAYAKAMALGEHDAELAALYGMAALGETTPVAGPHIRGKLSLSDRAARIVLPTDTVFIFARAVGGSGAPAAVVQRPAAELPLDFVLSDEQSMVPGIKLSSFDEVIVTARISRSGNATESLQDLEAKTSAIVIANSDPIELLIE